MFDRRLSWRKFDQIFFDAVASFLKRLAKPPMPSRMLLLHPSGFGPRAAILQLHLAQSWLFFLFLRSRPWLAAGSSLPTSVTRWLE